MGRAKTFLLLIFASIFCNVYAAKEVIEIVVQVPDLGYIKGRTVETLGNLGKPKKSYHNFRNIPFAKSVSNQYRFSVRILFVCACIHYGPSMMLQGKIPWKDPEGSLQLLWGHFTWKDPSKTVN